MSPLGNGASQGRNEPKRTEPPSTPAYPPTRCNVSLRGAAIKDDHEDVSDEIIKKVFDDMMAFDRAGAEEVIELIVRRNSAARNAFRVLFKNMQLLRRAGLLGSASMFA